MNELAGTLTQYLDGLSPWVRHAVVWTFQALLIVLAIAIFSHFVDRLLVRVGERMKLTSNPWDDAALNALHRPLRWLVWVVGLSFAALIIASRSDGEIPKAIGTVRDVGVILCCTWFLLRLVRNLEAAYLLCGESPEGGPDKGTVDAVSKLIRVSVLIMASLVLLQTLGYSIAGLLAFGGIGGIIVGLAAKDMIANFFGGLGIILDRPFTKGDWIYSTNGEVEGTVEHIGWRHTRVRTFDKRPIYVPNLLFTGRSVVNASRMRHRRIKTVIGIRYEDIDYQKCPPLDPH